MAEFTASFSHSADRAPWYLQPGWVFSGLFLFSLLFFLALIRVPRVDGQLIGSDGAYYYVYVRSIVIDHDLAFTNEYSYYHLPTATAPATPTGLAPNKYAIGPAILWMPFFLAAHALATIGSSVGLRVIPDGYGYLYQAAISIGSIVYGTLGFWLAYLSCRRVCSQIAALSAIILLWLASNSFYYMVFEPSMSHMDSLFSVALLLTIWFLRFRDAETPAFKHAVMLGIAGGLVLLVRLQDAPFLIIPYGTMLLRCVDAWRCRNSARAYHWLGLGVLTALLTIVVFSPQFAAWHMLYGTWLPSAYLGEHTPAFYWLQPQIVGVLFSTFHGLFSWHPVYLFALIGLFLLIPRDRSLAVGLLIVLALNVYIVAAWWAWWQGDAFGGRMFLNAMWVWLLGLSILLDRVRIQRVVVAAVALGIILVVWNGLSLMQYRLGFVPMSRALTWQQMTIDRLSLPWTLVKRFVF